MSAPSAQHTLLLELDDGKSNVFYVAPRLDRTVEINHAWATKQVARRSIFVRPQAIGILDDQSHRGRFVEIGARDLDEAFKNMWAVSSRTRAKKPLHRVSINPMKDERLTDDQVLRICRRLEKSYGYGHGDHQRVIVEHIKDGRQHFHVVWNRVNLRTERPVESVWPRPMDWRFA